MLPVEEVFGSVICSSLMAGAVEEGLEVGLMAGAAFINGTLGCWKAAVDPRRTIAKVPMNMLLRLMVSPLRSFCVLLFDLVRQ